MAYLRLPGNSNIQQLFHPGNQATSGPKGPKEVLEFLSEQQYRAYAGNLAVYTTLAEQRKAEQEDMTKAEAAAPPALSGPAGPGSCQPCQNVTRRSQVYSHFTSLGNGRYHCHCCALRVLNTGRSTSALFSHLKRRHYATFVKLATASAHSKMELDPQSGSLRSLMTFRQALVHNFRLAKWLGCMLSIPITTMT